MKKIVVAMVIAIAVGALVAAQQKTSSAGSGAARASDGHPDLSGTWAYTVALPPLALKRSGDGKASVKGIDSGRAPAAAVKGALPSTSEPSYKTELLAKVKDLEEHESKTDPVFYCDRPGIPRIGPPRRIVQLPGEMIFLYEDMSGDAYRIVPTDGRPHRADANPSYYGDSVAHWEGDTLIVDVRNFVEDTWFGENGYFHSDAMRVTERFWRDGANLVYQATVYDPKVLATPWTMAARVVKPSTEPLEESPKCVESDSKLLVNNDHHIQR
jgi:hypothetical protein